MRALVEEERHALADGVDVDEVLLQFIRERLFDVTESLPEFRELGLHAVEDAVHVGWVHDRAVEVGGEEFNAKR